MYQAPFSGEWRTELLPPAADGQLHSVVATKVQAETAEELKFVHHVDRVNGVPHTRFCGQSRWEHLDKNIHYKPDDIVIASYPKCGTTWSEQCVLLLLNHGDASKLNPATKNTYLAGSDLQGKVWPEACLDQKAESTMGPEATPLSFEDFAAIPFRRVIKSHATPALLLGCDKQGVDRLPPTVKVLVVTRNPMDACVSSYYHAFNPFKSGWPFDAWASVWLDGLVSFGGWFPWVKDWLRDCRAHPERCLWIQYEDLQKNPHQTVRTVAEFIGVEADAATIDKVVQLSSFDSMKTQAESKGGDTMGHLRQGKSGAWRSHFDAALAQKFVDAYTKEMVGQGITYDLGDGMVLASV